MSLQCIADGELCVGVASARHVILKIELKKHGSELYLYSGKNFISSPCTTSLVIK